MTTGEASNASEEQVTYGPSYEGFKGSESSKDIGDLFKSAVAVKGFVLCKYSQSKTEKSKI
jgi:hypothetical protein